jgi:hypothetical protein
MVTIIRQNHARNRFDTGSGGQKPGAGDRRNETIYLFVFIGLNDAGATSAGIRSQPFGSSAGDVLYIGRRSGFLYMDVFMPLRTWMCMQRPAANRD